MPKTMMRMEELLNRVTEFDAGLPPHLNGYLIESDDDPSCKSHHRVKIASTGKTGWAIRDGGYCLSRTGGWEHEPQPSNRSEAVI